MALLHITDLEAAINFWRFKALPTLAMGLGVELSALSETYAQMVFDKADWIEETVLSVVALEAWLVWYASTPDTPCIAICSTSQGDTICKGCGRFFEEIRCWPEMTPAQKRKVWQRITNDGTALRFTRYAERSAMA